MLEGRNISSVCVIIMHMRQKKISTYFVSVNFSFFDGQVDGFSGNEPVREDFLDRWKSDTLTVIPVNDSDRENVSEETFVHDVTCLCRQLDEIIEIGGSCKQKLINNVKQEIHF